MRKLLYTNTSLTKNIQKSTQKTDNINHYLAHHWQHPNLIKPLNRVNLQIDRYAPDREYKPTRHS